MKFNKETLKKHAPTAMIVGGVIGVVGSGVWACKKTVKWLEIKERTQNAIEAANRKLNSTVNPEYPEYDKKANRKEITKIYGRAALDTIKVYAAPVATGIVSITAILGGHKIIKNRYVAVSAAYATLETTMEGYRERVKAKIGDEKEEALFHNFETVTEEIEDEKTKKTKKVKKKIYTGTGYDIEFSKLTAPGYASGDLERDKMLVQGVETSFNTILSGGDNKKGIPVVLLKDLDKALGLLVDEDRFNASCVVGWRNDPSDPNADCRIKIGTYETTDVNGEPCLMLTFNVDGRVVKY